MVISEIEFENQLVEICAEKQRRKLAEERKAQIRYEWSMYKFYCLLWDFKPCLLSSLELFKNYCFEHGIELVK